MWWLLLVSVPAMILLHKSAKPTEWWSYAIPPVVTTVLILAFSAIGDYLVTGDTEFHGGWIREAIHNQSWTETYTETETETYRDGKETKTRSKTVTKTRFHPAETHAKDSNGYEISISYEHFQALAQRFGNEVKTKPWRSGQSSWGDGYRFTTTYDGRPSAFTPCFTKHNYRNKVIRSRSVFNFKEVSKLERQQYQLYDYPPITNFYEQKSILGWNQPDVERKLAEANAKLGSSKQVRIFVLVFRNQPLEAGFKQQALWKNGNKNEVVTCVNIDQNNAISWVYSFGWDNDRLLVDLREDVMQIGASPIDMNRVCDTIIEDVAKQFVRKHFKDFDYIRVEPPAWLVFVAFVVTVLTNFFLVKYIVEKL